MTISAKRQRALDSCAALAALACLGVAALGLTGCDDKGKISEKGAAAQIASVVATVDQDVGELERGLPVGAGKAAAILYKNGDPRDDLGAVRKGLAKVQREVPDLTAAKSTFFALVDAKGVAVRNNLEIDVMGGRDLFALFPSLREATSKPIASGVGLFAEAVGVRDAGTAAGVDPTWIAAAAIRSELTDAGAPQVLGYLTTGWSFRRFAYHLQEALRVEEKTKMLGTSDAKLAILYVAVFDAEHVYTAPQTPQINEEALEKLGLSGKTEAGVASGVLDLEGRPFGWAATRTPKWGPQLGVVLLRSEV